MKIEWMRSVFFSCGVLLTLCTVVPAGASAAAPLPNSATGDHQRSVANDGEVVDSNRELPPIVVSPGRAPEEAFTRDRTVRRVDREQLNRLQAQGAPEALQETAGVMAQKTNRGAGAPFLRGLVGPRNLLVVDGVRFSNSTFRTGPNQYLTLLDPSSFRGYEVLMGPASVIYGSDAMGGVVAAKPWSMLRRTGHSGVVGLRAASADLSTSVFGTAAFRGATGGVRVGGALRQFGQLTTGDGTKLPLSDYTAGAWHLRGQYDLSKRTSLGLSWFGARIRDAGRIDRLNNGRFRLYDNDSDIGWIELKHRSNKGLFRSLRVLASFHRTREDVERFRCKLNDPQTERDACIAAGLPARHRDHVIPGGAVQRHEQWQDTVMTPGFLAVATWRLRPGLSGSLGAEGQRDTVTATFRERRASGGWTWKEAARGHFSNGSTYVSGGSFATLDADIARRGEGRLSLTAGSRLSLFSAAAQDVPQFGTVEHAHVGVVSSLGLKWQQGQSWVAWFNASQGMRAPNLQEATVLGDTGSKIEVPNGALRPESSIALEAGARIRGERLALSVVGFGNLLRDTIDERELTESEWGALGLLADDVGTKPVVQRVNSGSGRFFGAELSAVVQLGAGLSVSVKGSLIRGEIDRAEGAVTARRNPPPMGVASLRWRVRGAPGAQLEIFSRFAAAQSDLHPSDERDLRICEDPAVLGTTYSNSGASCPGTPAWATANIRAAYQLSKALRVDLAALNLLDTTYRYHGSGVDEPGRGVALSLTGRM